ncbi:phage tail protein [Paludibacterium denitrificans]|uniref:DUF6242 domain-containing protein n=1 Tax=Paludibacterium denitrificans TaxID=2675226 RepID=A0A844GGB1_9NEIS|nr:phage tail protein [Paludibacterium denitrificans]MTD33927.1 hypothetical protein [Paludibacterium denitrificans]
MSLLANIQSSLGAIGADIKSLFNRGSSKTGDILYAADAPGPDWLPCDGSAYLQSSYPALYGKLGTIPTSNLGDLVPQILPTSNWMAVAFGNGMFVALAAGSGLYSYSSPDGINWTKRSMGATASWDSVAYGNGVFVAVANGTATMATSSDGMTWTTHTMPNSYWKAVAFGNGVFVALANNTSIAATSPDGVTWTQRAIGISANWSALTYGNGVFVAVAMTNNTVCATSPDGVTWTFGGTLPVNASWTSIAYGNGVFVAVGSSGFAVSADGQHWTGGYLPYISSIGVVIFCNGYFAAFNASGYFAATSTDGIVWSKHTQPAAFTCNSAAFGGGMVVVLPASGVVYGISPDGPRYSYDTGTQFVVPDIDALDGRISQLKAYVRT